MGRGGKEGRGENGRGGKVRGREGGRVGKKGEGRRKG
jgi:hypothetical protein